MHLRIDFFPPTPTHGQCRNRFVRAVPSFSYGENSAAQPGGIATEH